MKLLDDNESNEPNEFNLDGEFKDCFNESDLESISEEDADLLCSMFNE